MRQTYLLVCDFSAGASAKLTTENWLIQVYLAIPDFDIVAAIRIGAYPSLVVNCCPLATEIGQGHQISFTALLTFGERIVVQSSTSQSKMMVNDTLKIICWQENLG
jgi:hypothetical protein